MSSPKSEEKSPIENTRQARWLGAIQSISQRMVGTLDVEAICQAVCDICVKDLGYRMAWVGLVDYQQPGMTCLVAQSGVTEIPGTVQPHKDADPPDEPWCEEARGQGYCSSVAFPLKISGDVIGALTLYAAEPDAFGDEDVLVVSMLAAHTATAVENARRLQAECRQRQVAEMLRDLVVMVNSTLDVDQVLDIVVHRLQGLFQASACSVSFLEEDGETFLFQASTDPGLDMSQRITFPAEMSVAGRAIREGEVQVDNNLDLSPDFRAEITRRTEVVGRSMLTAPLFAEDKPVGVIQVLNASRDAFTEADATLLGTTAALIETAVARVHAYTQAVQLAEAEHRQHEVAEALRQAGAVLTSTLNFEEVLDRILEQMSRVVPHDAASIMLIERDIVCAFRWRGYAQFGVEDYVASVTFNVTEVPNLRTMQETRQPLAIPHVENYAGWLDIPEVAWIKSYAGAPLRVRDQVIGFLNVDSATPGFYSHADAVWLQAFADQAATAIENARLFQAAQDARQFSDLLREIGTSLASTLDLDEVVSRVLDGLAKVVPYDSASVMLMEDESHHIKAGRDFPDDSPIWTQTFAIAEGSLIYEICHSQKPLIIPDVYQEPRWIKLEGTEHIRCWLGVPLVVREQVIGILNLDHRRPGFYTQEHAAIASAFATQAAIAVENARLYEAEHKRRAEMERRNRELAALYAVAAAVSSSLKSEVVLREALVQALAITEMGAGAVYLLDESGSALNLHVQHNLPQEVAIEGKRFEMDTSLSGRVTQTGRPVAVQDMRAIPDDLPIHQATCLAALESGYQSLVIIPLHAQGHVLGVFYAISRQPREFSPEDLNLMMAIGDQMGVAIQNTQLLQDLQGYTAELEARVEARTAEVNRERERLLAVLESAGEGIVITDDQGRIEYANPAWSRLTGYSAQEAVGQSLRILQSGRTPSEIYHQMWNTIQSGRMWRGDLMDWRQDGSLFEMSLTISPVTHEQAGIVNYVGIFRDVTEFKKLARMKDEFLSTAAHELRNPLTSIMGFSELLLTRQDLSDEKRSRFLDYINSHAIHLKQIIDSLLDISRIESGEGLVMKLQPLNLYSLFEKEMQSWQEANPNHTYQLQAGGDLKRAGELAEGWPRVYADQGRVRQVIYNLLSNATKYSPDGGTITVSATLAGGYLEVTVADEGIGMTENELAHIFEKFWRADASSTAVEGTGLGLVNVRYIVEQQGGHIWVESTKGEGAVVHFTLPLVDREMKVLIVEDEDAVREIERRILTRNDIATLTAGCGQEAIEIARTHRPDLILLDLTIPGVSGKEVIQTLKANPATAHIPIIVVSACSDWQTIEESYILGVVDFLAKPFEYEEFLKRIRRALKISVGSRGQPKRGT